MEIDKKPEVAERGLMISNKSIRRWVLKCGPTTARNLREIRPKPYTRWHLDEMVSFNRWTANVHVAGC
jgi:putative transposase